MGEEEVGGITMIDFNKSFKYICRGHVESHPYVPGVSYKITMHKLTESFWMSVVDVGRSALRLWHKYMVMKNPQRG